MHSFGCSNKVYVDSLAAARIIDVLMHQVLRLFARSPDIATLEEVMEAVSVRTRDVRSV